VEECTSTLTRARRELGDTMQRLEAERDDLKHFLDERTRELEGSLVGRLDAERGQVESACSEVEASTGLVKRLSSIIEKDAGEMKRRMIYPTVQLKGNGTVGSGVLVYSEPQPGLEAPGGAVYTTFVLTAYHVVVEVLGDRAEAGIIDEVHVLLENGTESTEVFPAKLVLFDRPRDVALLRINSTRRFQRIAELMSLEDLDKVDVFSRAYAVGCPLGNRPLPTLGEISSKSKVVSDQTFWMLNAPTFFGNSGGGVYQADTCKLMGVSSMIYTYGKANPTVVPHLGLFVPLGTVYHWLDAEGYSFVQARGPVPREMLWKLVHVEGNTPLPRAAAATGQE
jgi:S1-C subfamily serine protease